MISAGGWNNSQLQAPGGGTVIAAIAASSEARKAYVASCVDTFLRSSSPRFDGIDLDWEFPRTAEEATNFAALARAFRTELNEVGKAAGTHYVLSASVSLDPATYGGAAWAEMQHSFDWLNLMAYNMNIPLGHAGHQLTRFNSPLHASPDEPPPQGPNIDAAIQAYLNAGVVPGKIVLGVTGYARSYAGVGPTNGGLYQPYTGLGPGTWTPGTLSYEDVFENYLPQSDAPAWDDATESTSMYVPDQSVWISPQLAGDVVAKATYAVKGRLGGLMFWELGADTTDENSLLGFMDTALRNTPD
jgi:chitinase